jgi:hypothetical protein
MERSEEQGRFTAECPSQDVENHDHLPQRSPPVLLRQVVYGPADPDLVTTGGSGGRGRFSLSFDEWVLPGNGTGTHSRVPMTQVARAKVLRREATIGGRAQNGRDPCKRRRSKRTKGPRTRLSAEHWERRLVVAQARQLSGRLASKATPQVLQKGSTGATERVITRHAWAPCFALHAASCKQLQPPLNEKPSVHVFCVGVGAG